jgi:probable addiction module antidote protein
MLTREDGTPITPDNLTDEDVALSRWTILDHLDSEENIASFLEGVKQDIEEGECDSSFFATALADASKARSINQLVRETGLDRELFYGREDSDPDVKAPEISHDVIVKVTKAFVAAPLPV